MSTPSEIKVSIFGGAKAKHGTTTTLAIIMNRIRGDEFSESIQKIREEVDKGKRNNLKSLLLAFTPSGTFSSRESSGLLQHSGIVCADIDGLDAHTADALRNQLKGDTHTEAVFVSPGGKGVKAFFRCDATRTHSETWRACDAYVKTTYGHALDPATKDVNRLCYLSHDPLAYMATGHAEVIPYPVSTEPSTQTVEPVACELSQDDVRELLRHVPPAPPYDKWIRVASAVWSVLPEAEGTELLEKWSPGKTPGEYSAKFDDRLENISIGTLINFAKEGGWKPSPMFKAKLPDAAIVEAENLALFEKLATREFGVGPIPVEPVPRFLLNGVPTCTPGNITTISAQSKAGKTALVTAIVASAIVAESGEIAGQDCLGVTAAAPGGRMILHIDTEQSPYDHHRAGTVTLQRAGIASRPLYFRSFRLAGSGAKELCSIMQILVQQEHEKSGLFAVILDGIGDFVDDVNDAKECNPLVAELHNLAIRFDCPVIVIIHENPAQKNGKSRGHLGSQLERKSETNLRLKKKDGTTVVFAEKTRGAPISEKHGPRYAWSDEQGMHVSVPSDGQTAESAHKIKALRLLAEECLGHIEFKSLRYVDLRTSIITARGFAQSTAERRIEAMVEADILRHDQGSVYTLVPVTP